MPTPNAVDYYTRYMHELFDDREMQSVPKAFQSLFGNPIGASRTSFSPDQGTFEQDIIKANGERLAVMVHRGQVSDDVSRIKNGTDYNFTNVVREYPLIETDGNINSKQLLLRQPGDNPYARRTQLDRNRMLARDNHMDEMRKQCRTWEYLASQAILTGKMPAIIGTTNTNLLYDYYRLATHTVTVDNAWDSGSQDILGDIDGALDLIREDAYMQGDFLAIGGSAMAALIADTTVQNLADNRRFELIQVSLNNPVPPRFDRVVAAGWTAYGRLRTPKGREVWMFTNDDVYTDASGTTQNYMPLDKAFLMPINARMDRTFGPRDRLPVTPSEAAWYMEMFGFDMSMPPMPGDVQNPAGIIMPEAFYHDAYTGQGMKTVVLRSQSAPVFITTQTDAIVVLDGLIE